MLVRLFKCAKALQEGIAGGGELGGVIRAQTEDVFMKNSGRNDAQLKSIGCISWSR